MALSSLRITLSDDSTLALQALAALYADRRCDVVERSGQNVALVCDTPSVSADKELWEWLNSIRGIVSLNLVCVFLDENKRPAR